jgi:cytochrome c peroxidase
MDDKSRVSREAQARFREGLGVKLPGATRPNDRYKFRTSPIRNVALQPTFFHNGAFTRLEDAIRHHLDVFASARNYNPVVNVAPDLAGALGPIEPVLERVDPILRTPIQLDDDEFRNLVDFVRNGLLDSRAEPGSLRKLIPKSLPSGFPVLTFQ